MYWNVLKDSFSNLISVAKEAKSSSFGTESAITSTIIKTWFCIPSDTTLTVTFRCTGDWLQFVVERMHCLASHRRHSFLTLQEYKSKLLRSKLDVRSLMSQRKFWKKIYNFHVWSQGLQPRLSNAQCARKLTSVNCMSYLLCMVSRITTTKVSIPGLTDEHQQPQKYLFQG